MPNKHPDMVDKRPCYGGLNALFGRITGKPPFSLHRILKRRHFLRSYIVETARNTLFWPSNALFSLFFPVKQANRTDAGSARDGPRKCRLISLKRRQEGCGRYDLARTNRPVPRACGRSLQTETSAGGGWRSGWDSNPRYAFDVYTLSRRAPSTTRPPLRLPSLCAIASLLERLGMQERAH
jgi:hypothetical protein